MFGRLGRDKHISRWVDRENLIYVRRNSIKTLSEVKPIKNTSKNPQSFLEICSGQKGVLPWHKAQNHVYEKQKPFRFKEDNLSHWNSYNQLSHPSLSHIDARMSGDLDSRKESTKFQQRPRTFVKVNLKKNKFVKVKKW